MDKQPTVEASYDIYLEDCRTTIRVWESPDVPEITEIAMIEDTDLGHPENWARVSFSDDCLPAVITALQRRLADVRSQVAAEDHAHH